MAIRHTFKVYERLKRKQHIETLFQNGKAFSAFPVKCICLPVSRADEPSPVRAGVVVPKKRIRLSVQRQRIKRLIREAWRLQKHILYNSLSPSVQLHVFFIYTGAKDPEYQELATAVNRIIATLAKEYQGNEYA